MRCINADSHQDSDSIHNRIRSAYNYTVRATTLGVCSDSGSYAQLRVNYDCLSIWGRIIHLVQHVTTRSVPRQAHVAMAYGGVGRGRNSAALRRRALQPFPRATSVVTVGPGTQCACVRRNQPTTGICVCLKLFPYSVKSHFTVMPCKCSTVESLITHWL